MDLPAISFFKSALEMSAMLTVRTWEREEQPRTQETETEQKTEEDKDNEKTSETAVTDSGTIKVKKPLNRGLL